MASRPTTRPDSDPWDRSPQIRHVPEYVSSLGVQAVYLAEMAGLVLDPWQEAILIDSLGVRADKRWAAFEVGVCVPRQNGKGALLEARELAGLFLLGERLIIHSAHLFDTSLEHFERIVGRIEDTPQLMKRVAKNGISRSHGKEAIRLKTGQRLAFRARSKGGGRGFTADLVVLDEAMDCPEAVIGALMPTLSSRPNPQLWMTGSAVDQNIMENGVAFARIRERGIEGTDPALVYYEWSRPENKPHEVLDPMDPAGLRKANPAMDIRISEQHTLKEARSMAAETFAVERLNVGDWPRTDGLDGMAITPEEWEACKDPASTIVGPVCLAIDADPDRRWWSIGVCGRTPAGDLHVEMIERRNNGNGIIEYVRERMERHAILAVMIDGRSPANSLREGLTDALSLGALRQNEITVMSSTQHAEACGMFADAVKQGRLRHLGQRELLEALRGATKRSLTDAWAWNRKDSSVDISPLVACTLALWGTEVFREGTPRVWI